VRRLGGNGKIASVPLEKLYFLNFQPQ